MTPSYRYNQDTDTPYIFSNRRYWIGEKCCRWGKRQWKLGNIEEAKKWYHLPVGYQKQDLNTPLRTFYELPIRNKLPRIELGLLLYPKCFKIWEFGKDFALIFARRSRRPKKVLYWI